MADNNGTANGTAVLGDETKPPKVRRPRPTYIRLITGRGSTTGGRPYSLAANTILPPPEYDQDWKNEVLDTNTLQYTNPTKLLELLANLSPEMSKGLWDYMRLLNPGWSYEVFSLGSETPNTRAKTIIDGVLDKIKQKHGSVDVVLGRLHMGAYMRGGYFGEAVFDKTGREMEDIATPDPASVRFKVIEDTETRQKRYQLGQWQADGNKFVPLDEEEGVSYIPVDPFPGNPYGRPLVAPAMFSALFLLGLLHDLRRVISQQGWPRIHIRVLTEKLLEGLQADDEDSTPEAIEKKLEGAINTVRDEYAKLQPDDAFITGDEVEIGGPIAVATAANLTGVEGVIEVVERMLVRALKTMPLMLGITDGVSEANANRQWEITVSGVKALQHLAESMLERFFELACRMQGVQANVVWTFAEIRAAERQRDALAESQEIDNQYKLLDRHLIDRDEAAMTLVGHPPALTDEEVAALAPDTSDDEPEEDVQDSDENPEPGTANASIVWGERVAPSLTTRYGATEASWCVQMHEEGKDTTHAVLRLLRDAQGLSVTHGVTPAGNVFRLWQIGRDRRTGDDYGRYAIYRPRGRAGAVPATSDRHPVGRRTDERHGDGERRRAGESAVRARSAGLRRPARRGAGLRGR